MASESELAVVLRLKDEASAAMKRASQQMTGFGNNAKTASQHASSFGNTLRSIGATAAGFTLATVGIQGISGAFSAIKDASFGMNVSMENVRAQLVAFTKDGATADAILRQIRTEADKTPFAFNEMAQATAGLMSSAKISGAALMDLVKMAEILAASHPEQGLQGAAFAIREAVGGDFTSLAERFDLPRQYINKLKEEGVPNLEIISKAMLQNGYDADLVANLAQTASGKWSTLMDTFSGLASKISQPIFERFKIGLDKAQDAAGSDAMSSWADNTAAAIDVVLDGLGTLGPAFNTTFSTILDIVGTIGRTIYEAMSWLNPFATHSPSLVSQVQEGTAQIKQAYDTTGTTVKASLNSTSTAVTGLNNNLAKTGTSASAAKTALEAYKKQVGDIKTQLDRAKQAIQDFSNAPLAGSEAWDQQIFQKQQQIDQMELQMLQFQNSGLGQDAMQPKYEQMKQYRDALQDQLRIIELQKKIEQAPQLRAIELAKPYKELTSGEIIEGIRKNLGVVAELQPKYDAMNETLQGMEEAAKNVGSAVGGLNGPMKDLNGTFDDAKKGIDEAKAKYAELKAEWETNLKPGLDNLNRGANDFSNWIKANKEPIIQAFSAFGVAVVGIALGTALLNPLNAILIAVGLLSAAWISDFAGMRTETEKLANMIQGMLDNIREFVRLLGGIPQPQYVPGNQPGSTMGGGNPNPGYHPNPGERPPGDFGNPNAGNDMQGQGVRIQQNFYGYNPNQVGPAAKKGGLSAARAMGM